VNDIRFGYARQGFRLRESVPVDYVDFTGPDPLPSRNAQHVVHVPVNNLVDNFRLTKGNHTSSLGLIGVQVITSGSDASSYELSEV